MRLADCRLASLEGVNYLKTLDLRGSNVANAEAANLQTRQ